MTIIKYGEYQGEVTYEDSVLVIRLLHIDDLITTECNKASDVQAAFEDLVQDYIETCKALGKEPGKPFRGTFNVRIDPAIHRQVAKLAAEEGTSLNAWVARAIEARAYEQRIRREALSPRFLQRLILGYQSSTWMASHAHWKHPGQRSEGRPRQLVEQWHRTVGHG